MMFGSRPSLHSKFFPPTPRVPIVARAMVDPPRKAHIAVGVPSYSAPSTEDDARLNSGMRGDSRQPSARPSPVTLPWADAPVARVRFRTRREVIISMACTMFGITKAELISERRFHILIAAREYAAVRMESELRYSHSKIGKALGGRDHSTIHNLLNERLARRAR